MKNPNYRVFRVSGKTNPAGVAGALAPVIRTAKNNTPEVTQYAELVCMGAAAVNQAIKAIAILGGMVKPNDAEVAAIPLFDDVVVKGEERTAMRLVIIKI